MDLPNVDITQVAHILKEVEKSSGNGNSNVDVQVAEKYAQQANIEIPLDNVPAFQGLIKMIVDAIKYTYDNTDEFVKETNGCLDFFRKLFKIKQ